MDEDGQPADCLATRRFITLANLLEKISPALMNWLVIRGVEKSMRKSYPDLDPAWRLLPSPPPSHTTPIVNDYFIPLWASGAVTSIADIAEITESGTLITTDESTLQDLDAIIFCTGYQVNFNILASEIAPPFAQLLSTMKRHMVHQFAAMLAFARASSHLNVPTP